MTGPTPLRFQALDHLLSGHPCADDAEVRDVARIRAFVRAHPDDAHLRSQLLGHLTGSAFVLDASRTRVLLLHHARLDRWLQPGGHGEGETDLRAVALRELEEETGLCARDLTALDPPGAPAAEARLFDVDVHRIPESVKRGEPAHDHLDLRYAFVARAGAEARLSEESLGLAWVPLDGLVEGADAAMQRAIKKLRRAAGGRS